MPFFNKFRKFQVIRFYTGLMLVGIVLSAISGFLIYKTATTTYQTVDATVTGCEEFFDSTAENENDRIKYRYSIEYRVGDKLYTDDSFGEFSEPMNEGDILEIRYNVNDPTEIASVGGDYIMYIVMAAGILAFIFGLIGLIKAVKRKSSDFNEYDRVDESSFSQEQIDSVKNSTEPQREYFFHYAGKLNQGYVLEDKNKEHAYEANVISFNPLKPFVFEFKNCVTGAAKNVSISHTVSTSIGSGNSGFSGTPISSSFKIDGKNNWDYLAENGFSFEMSLDGIAPCFTVRHYGVDVAYIKTEGTNALRGKDSLIGKLPVNGLYSVRCRQSDLDMIFMVCVSIARAIFYENN